MVQAVSPVASREEIRLLYTPLTESRYRNVYCEGKDIYGNLVWEAHVKYRVRGVYLVTPDGRFFLVREQDTRIGNHTLIRNGRTFYGRFVTLEKSKKHRIVTSRSTNPAEAARYVIGWYKQQFGADWKRALLTRWKRQDRVYAPVWD